ncbi:MAG: glutathione S-transferase [Gammaproteobacteria bacterium]|nr:glutathione S-transferase [Gammaproteobacteria bacterium]
MMLYTFSLAPSPQRVEIFMKEKGINIPSETVDMMKQEQLSDNYKEINPRGTLPALVLDDGTVISEVVAICRYLEISNPDTPLLLGEDAKQQALIGEWDHRLESEFLLPIADALRNQGDGFKGRALPGVLDIEQIPQLVTRSIKRIKAFLEILDKQLSDNKFVAGDTFSMADITAYVGISFAVWVQISVPEELKNINRWFDEISKRNSLK